MIILEDSSFPIDNDFDSVIPFEIHVDNDRVTITAYDMVEDIANDFNNMFGNDPLSDPALEYLNSKLDPIIKKSGYSLDNKHLYNWYYSYYMDDIQLLNTDVILPNTVKWEPDSNYKNLTTIDLDFIEDRTIFVTLIDNKIVSYACENPWCEEDEFEIGVETALGYRNNGYALSNTSALTKYSLQLNYRVTYNCSRYNTTSQRIAEKVGFTSNGKRYYYICYRNRR